MPTSNSSSMAAALLALTVFLSVRSSHGAGADLVDITAEFSYTNRHAVWFTGFTNEESSCAVHCIVGTNFWFIEMNSHDVDTTVLFTGSNAVEHLVWHGVKQVPVDEAEWSTWKDDSNPLSTRMRGLRTKSVQFTNDWTNVWSSDGVLRGEPTQANAAWLAFCSGPYLKNVRKILLPNPSVPVSLDNMQTFPDELGLPKHVELIDPRGWAVGEYRVVDTTNFLGWTFPLHFEALFEPHLSIEPMIDEIGGLVTAIKPGKMPNNPGAFSWLPKRL